MCPTQAAQGEVYWGREFAGTSAEGRSFHGGLPYSGSALNGEKVYRACSVLSDVQRGHFYWPPRCFVDPRGYCNIEKITLY
jgi:hypothetical protein